jgi:hypothetical protein
MVVETCVRQTAAKNGFKLVYFLPRSNMNEGASQTQAS